MIVTTPRDRELLQIKIAARIADLRRLATGREPVDNRSPRERIDAAIGRALRRRGYSGSVDDFMRRRPRS